MIDGGVKRRIKFTLDQEIVALTRLKKSLNRQFYGAVNLLLKREGKIEITGLGKSAFVGMKMAATFVSLGHEALFVHPVDALHGDIGLVGNEDILIVISFSGESSEVVRMARYLKKVFDVKIIAISGRKNSVLSSLADYSVILRIVHEGCPLDLAPMASTTASLALGDLFASAITSPLDFKKSHFAKFHPGGTLGLKLKRVAEVMSVGRRIPLVTKDSDLQKALVEVDRKKFGIVGITDTNGKLVGVITDGDIRRFFLHQKNFNNVSVAIVMNKKPKMIQPDDSLEDALWLMEKCRITNLFVADTKKRPIGILHMHDIVESSFG